MVVADVYCSHVLTDWPFFILTVNHWLWLCSSPSRINWLSILHPHSQPVAVADVYRRHVWTDCPFFILTVHGWSSVAFITVTGCLSLTLCPSSSFPLAAAHVQCSRFTAAQCRCRLPIFLLARCDMIRDSLDLCLLSLTWFIDRV